LELGLSNDRATLKAAVQICGCFNLRRAARAVTRLYDQALEPGGLRSTGMVALAVVEAEGELTLPQLAQRLGVDRSTLTRNLAPLKRDGLLDVARHGIARTSTARLTTEGRATLKRCLPLWRQAQDRFEAMLGTGQWAQLLKGLDAITRSMPEA
jgi:DNA-binding MarR family transcriptional regulator